LNPELFPIDSTLIELMVSDNEGNLVAFVRAGWTMFGGIYEGKLKDTEDPGV
jgi:hypothetical protein